MPARNIIVESYSVDWAEDFQEIKRALLKILNNFALSVEHVGSTSVPGLVAKPIIDVDVIINRSDFTSIVKVLNRYGFFHNGDQGIVDREAFKPKNEHIKALFPPMHLYVCPSDSEELHQHLLFRNYLRNHPEDVRRYSEIKVNCAKICPHDIDCYMECKHGCITQILQKAALWGENWKMKQ